MLCLLCVQKSAAAGDMEDDNTEDIKEDESGWETASDEDDAAAARGDHDASTSQVASFGNRLYQVKVCFTIGEIQSAGVTQYGRVEDCPARTTAERPWDSHMLSSAQDLV